MSSACSSSYHRMMQSLRGIGSKKKKNNNEVGAWSLGPWRSGEARLLYPSNQSDNQTITRSKEAPLTNDPTPPYPPPGTRGWVAKPIRALLGAH